MAEVQYSNIGLDLRGGVANNLFLKPVFFDQSWDLFQVMPQVVNQQKIAYLDTVKDILQRGGSCNLNAKGRFSLYERTISVDPVAAKMEQCYADLKDTIYTELLKQGTDISDLSGTAFEGLIRERFQQAVRKDVEKLAFYGNKAATGATVANPNDISAINQTDGMWVYLTDLVSKDAIPWINTGSGSALNPGDGEAILREIWENQPNVMKARPASQKVFLVTQDLYYQYEEDIDLGTFNSAQYPNQIRGEQVANFKGIEVRPMWDWQEYAFRFQNQAQAHQVILTTKDNMVAGTNVANPNTEYRSWYDIDSELYKIRSRFTLGFNYKYEDFFVVGY